MKRSFQFLNSDSLPRSEDYELSSSEECDDQFYNIGNGLERMESPHLNRDISESLSASTPCMSDSRPTSSIDTGCDWEDSLLKNVATSDSCLVSTAGSSSAASPLMRISSPGMSPSAENKMSFSYPFACGEERETSLASLNDALRTERDFIDFVMSSFPLGEKPSYIFPEGKKSANDPNPKVGLDHLDNLCKLMEQLSDLKEANVRLKRRVQYLEDVKTLHEIHKEMTAEPKLSNSGPSEDDDRTVSPKKESPPHEEVFHDDVTERPHSLYRTKTSTIISKQQEVKRGGVHKSRTPSTVSQDRLRERSKSVGHAGSHSKAKKRISRWSKVKEALGIDKAENECDEHSVSCPCEQRNEGLISKVTNDETVDRQQVRREVVNSETKALTCTKNLSERGSVRNRNSGLSSHSFSKFYHEALEVKPEKKSGTLDCPKSAQRSMEEYEKEESFKKSPKSPWCKMKNIIQIRRDNRHHKGESRSSSNTSRNVKAMKTEEHQDSDHQCNCSHQRRPSKSHRDSLIKENRRNNHDNCSPNSGREKLCDVTESSFRDNAVCLRQKTSITKRPQFKEQINGGDSCSKQNSDKPQQTTKDRAQTHAEKQERHSSSSKPHHSVTPASKENGKRKKPKPRPLNLHSDTNNVHCENVQSTEEDRETPKTPGSSPQIHRKWVWTRVKDVLRGGKRDDGARLSISVPSSPSSSADVVAFNFQPVEGEALAEDPVALPYSKTDLSADMRETDTLENPTMSDLLQELQRNLSDDFNKKLDEWQRLRSEGVRIPNLSVERKDSFGRLKKISMFDKKFTTGEKAAKQTNNIQKKDISWLEKELQKVEREILRLSKEKQKFEKRAFRLKRLKDAMTDAHQKKEVLVRTSAGEFRFEGISDAFTKKLYEWERKNGVLPELSTIALLDECLQDKHKKFSDALKVDRLSATNERGGLSSQSSRSSLSPDSTIKTCFQASRASSEPDLSSLSAQKEGCIQTRSKSGDTLLSTSQNEKSTDGLLTAQRASPVDDNDQWTPKTRDTVQTEDSYYCLLEENMFLLDQLKSKEELCRQLQNELDRVDNKSDKTNKTHEEEMEKYRMKLWEIHMSRPRDLQGSLHLISELKKRIEELQKCSDKLKLDRQSLEESFRFHSEQQSQLTRDLIEKVRDLQEAGQLGFFHRSGCRRRCRKQVKCDFASVSRIHYLTTMLLEQGRETELALMERTRQVCHLRWELLQRDMSAVLLQAALHRVNWQGEPAAHVAAWSKKRSRFRTHKSWTFDTTARCQSQECVTEPWSQERLRQVTVTPFTDWANMEFNPNDMMSTIHELKKEALKMSCFRLDRFSEAEDPASKTVNGSAESEMADSDRLYDTGSAVNSRSSSFSSGPGGLRGSHSDTRLYEKSRDLCRRRNSSSSMSCLSGMDASDSSSLHDSDRMRFLMRRRPWTRWRSRDNVSTPCSSQSSVMEDEMNSCKWDQPVDADDYEDSAPQNQLQLRYGSLNENDEHGDRNDEKLNAFVERGSQCLITPKPIHLVLNVAEGGESEDSSSQTFSSKMVSPGSSRIDNLSRYSQDRSVDRSFSSEMTTVHISEDQSSTLSTHISNSYSVLDEDMTYSDSVLIFNDTDDERVRHEDLYYSSENSEMAYLKSSSLSGQMMDSEKTEFSSILYPSLNPSPYNSGDDLGYTFSKQHTNTDESNTSPEHSEMEVLNITHPVHDFLLYSPYPPIQTIHEHHASFVEGHPNSLFQYQYPITVTNGKNEENSNSQVNESLNHNISSLFASHVSSNNTRQEIIEVPERTYIHQLQHQIGKNSNNSYNNTEESNREVSQKSVQDKPNSSTAHCTTGPSLLHTASDTSTNFRGECSISTVSTGKPQNIAQIKYKGTKGFGKCATKWEFRREFERNQMQNHAAALSLSTNQNVTNHLTQPSSESNGT